MPNLDETELARLEELALPYARLQPSRYEDTQNICTRAVPALVAEVRRLREALNTFIEEDQSRVILVQRQMLDCMRGKVEAWEWWDEVRTYDPWSEHPYCTACGNRSKRGKIFDCAVDEYEKIKSTAREAVHADRE